MLLWVGEGMLLWLQGRAGMPRGLGLGMCGFWRAILAGLLMRWACLRFCGRGCWFCVDGLILGRRVGGGRGGCAGGC